MNNTRKNRARLNNIIEHTKKQIIDMQNKTKLNLTNETKRNKQKTNKQINNKTKKQTKQTKQNKTKQKKKTKKKKKKKNIPSNVRIDLPLALKLHSNKLISDVLRGRLVVVSSLVVSETDSKRSSLDLLGEDITLVQEKNDSSTLEDLRLAQLTEH